VRLEELSNYEFPAANRRVLELLLAPADEEEDDP
jgi:hypothetical protein